MIQHFAISFNRFFNSNSIHFYDPLSADEFQLLELFYINHLETSSFHCHHDGVCKSPNLACKFSYTRNYITFKNNSVIEGSVDVPVFYCESCHHYHALLPLHFIAPYCQYSISFILCVLQDKLYSSLTVKEITEKYTISKSTLYRWMNKYHFILSCYLRLRNKYCTILYLCLLYCFEEVVNDLFDMTSFSLFQCNRKLSKPPPSPADPGSLNK